MMSTMTSPGRVGLSLRCSALRPQCIPYTAANMGRVVTFRQTFASGARQEPDMIGKLLGYQVQTAARYTHRAQNSIEADVAHIIGGIGQHL